MKTLQPLPIFAEMKSRLERLPPPKTEESILLRVLVQALVIVGILAIDIASEVELPLWMSWWAIPFSIIGAVFSWNKRKGLNITAKFLIAIGMLLILLLFFVDLTQNLNDTRLVLAKLLVQLQVLHSFDLPRRKDLGYSMVIGLILLGVAGTISQTLAFAPVLLVFLGIGVPILVLDYRSRLGLDPIDGWFFPKEKALSTSQKQWLKESPLTPSRFISFGLVILLLGLSIFALMPRFRGYQLQTFPVQFPKEFEGQAFKENEKGVFNQGYVSQGKEGTGQGQMGGNSPVEGKGKMDGTEYYGFNSQINQNLRGELKKKALFRVRSQSPGFFRVMAFDQYTGQGWKMTREKELITVKRPYYSYRFTLNYPLFKTRTQQVIQSFTAVTELPNIIPALSYPVQLYFPTAEVGIDLENGLRSPLGLSNGLTYTVISQVPYRDQTKLSQAKSDYTKTISKYYLQIPPSIQEKVKMKTEEFLATSPKPLMSNYNKALYLAQILKQRYPINPNVPFLEEGEDLVTSFLEKGIGGYPDHFNTVLTVMLRSIGIPARLATGFGSGQFNPFTGYYIVHNTDAYGLTEVFFPEYGWFTFDAIPGHDIIPVSIEEDQTFGLLGQLWKWVASWLPSPVVSFLKLAWEAIFTKVVQVLYSVWGFISGSLIGFLTGIIIFLVLAFLLWLGVVQFKDFQEITRLKKLPPMPKLYQQMLRFLKQKGYPKHPAQTPLEYAYSARSHHPPEIAEVIEAISEAYTAWRYGRKEQNMIYLRQQFNTLKRGLKKVKV